VNAAAVLSAVLPFFLPLAVLGVSIRLSLREVRGALRERAALARVCVICLIVPLVAATACKLFGPQGLTLAIVLLSSMAPGDPLAVLDSREKHGDVRLALALAIVLTFLMPVTLFVWTPIMDALFAGHLHESAAGAFLKVVTLIMPFLLGGMALRTYASGFAEAVDMPIQIVSRVAYVALAAIASIVGFRHILETGLATIACVFVITAVSIFLGHRLSGYTTERKRRTAGLAVALGNTGVLLYVGLDTYHLEVAKVCAVVVTIVLVRTLSVALWNLLGRNSLNLALSEPE